MVVSNEPFFGMITQKQFTDNFFLPLDSRSLGFFKLGSMDFLDLKPDFITYLVCFAKNNDIKHIVPFLSQFRLVD
jgi:hypothetical protein